MSIDEGDLQPKAPAFEAAPDTAAAPVDPEAEGVEVIPGEFRREDDIYAVPEWFEEDHDADVEEKPAVVRGAPVEKRPPVTENWVITAPGVLSSRPMFDRLYNLWPLLRIWVGREYSARYRQSILNILWSLVNPVAQVAIYGVLMVAAFNVKAGNGIPYLPFAWAGMTAWTFFSVAMAMAVPSLIYDPTFSKAYFPREAVPLSIVGVAFVDLLIQTVILFGITMIQGVGIDYHVLWLLPIYVILGLITAGMAMLLSAITVFVRDVQQVNNIALSMGFFATPIMYPVSQYPHWLVWTAKVNPLAVLIEQMRMVTLHHLAPTFHLLAIEGVLGVVLFVAGVCYIRKVEARMADLV